MEQTLTHQETAKPSQMQNSFPPRSLAKELDVKQVGGLVTRVFMLKNQNTNQASLIFTANELQKKLSGNYYYLTVEEVQKALENGVFGVYGEYYGISVVTMCKWLDDYLNSDERRSYIESNRPKRLAIEQTSTITDEEKLRLRKQFVLSKLDSFRKSKHINFAQHTYDVLIQLKLIDANEIYHYCQKAKKILNEKHKNAHGLKRCNFDAIFKDEGKYETEVISIAKELCAENFFRQIIDEGREDSFIKAMSI